MKHFLVTVFFEDAPQLQFHCTADSGSDAIVLAMETFPGSVVIRAAFIKAAS